MIPGLLAAIAVFSYLLGGLNGAIIASKYVFHRDVRDYGSGNAGLTNFFRTFGAPGLAIVIGTDVLKTVIAVVAGGLIMGTQGAASTGQVFAGFCVMLGHIYPVFYGFRGGKGVLCHRTGDKTGPLAGIAMVAPDDDIMLLSDSGVIIRTRVADIPVYGRAAAGVIVMRLTEGASLVSFAAVSPEDEESYGAAEQAGQTEDAETPESAADENG